MIQGESTTYVLEVSNLGDPGRQNRSGAPRNRLARRRESFTARALRNRIAHQYDAEVWRQIATAAYPIRPALLLNVNRAPQPRLI